MKSGTIAFLPLVVSVLLVASSCTTHRTAQFKEFAAAGQEYSQAMLVLAEEAGYAAIDADSEQLMFNHDLLMSAPADSAIDVTSQLETMILQQTEQVSDLLSHLNALRQHAHYLEEYFTALHALADSDAPDSIGAKTQRAITALGTIHPTLAAAKIGQSTVADFMGDATGFVVGKLKNKAMEKELRRHAPALERELELQSTVLRLLAEQMTLDVERNLDLMYHRLIAAPFVGEQRLRNTWKSERREMLSLRQVIPEVENASQAAQRLKGLLRDLVENKIRLEDSQQVFDDIHTMLDLIEKAQLSRANE